MTAKVLKGPWGQRKPAHEVWAPLWEDIGRAGCLPSLDQERVIAELVEEIMQLAARLDMPLITSPGGWLKGFIAKLHPELWPPSHLQDYNKIWPALKERKTQMQKLERRELSLITTKQNRHIRYLLNRDPYRDDAWLYEYIGKFFPDARREKNGRTRPSLSALTTNEAWHIIDVLMGKTPARQGKRRRA